MAVRAHAQETAPHSACAPRARPTRLPASWILCTTTLPTTLPPRAPCNPEGSAPAHP